MTKIVKNIPLLDLAAFLLESVESPKHVGALQIFEPVNGTSTEIVARVLHDFRASAVAPPFNYVPVFPTFGAPKWAECDDYDSHYHVRQAALPKPGTLTQLIELVTDLHAGIMDRSRPGYIAYIIEGLADDCFAVYWKLHHAYIDGASAIMRFDAAMPTNAEQLSAVPIWAPLMESPPQHASRPRPPSMKGLGQGFKVQAQATGEVLRELSKATLRARGLAPKRRAPLPFSAPKTLFNRPVHAQRRLGVGSLQLAAFKMIAKTHSVTVNEVLLTLVGAALERYAQGQGKSISKALVATCPLALRREGDNSASTQIGAISINLGEPGATLNERLMQVHASSLDAKEDASAMSREALMKYLLLVGGLAELVDRSPLAERASPLTNVNVSNVAASADTYHLSGARMVRNYPVSTLAGGTAINITFASMAGRMDYAIITDAKAIPQPQDIADYIAAACKALSGDAAPVRRRKASASSPNTNQSTAQKQSKSRPKTRAKMTEN